MSSPERMLRLGRLEEAKRKRDMAQLEADGLIEQIRHYIDPYTELPDLRLREADAHLHRLIELQQVMRTQQELIDKLESDLYG